MDISKVDIIGGDPVVEGLVPVTPAVFHILLGLVGGAAHGYAIMQAIEHITGGRVRVGNATLYRSLQKMAIDGLVEEFSDVRHQADERRREYRLTRLGEQVARAEARRMAALVEVARNLSLLAPRRTRRGRKRAAPSQTKN